MSNALAEACSGRPFSNGTEVHAWMATWCELCAHDHGMHQGGDTEPMCSMLLHAALPDETDWPEAWLPEPDDGRFFLPSRLVCLNFKACTEDGCCGDPGAEERAERITEVTVYWRDRARLGEEN